MKGVHVNWTAPFFEKHRLRGHGFQITRDLEAQTYDVPDYQALYTILSALRWKHHTKSNLKLYTDSIGLSFYKQLGILGLYDEINIDVLNNLEGVDPAYFWTSGKIHALEHETEPFTFLDQDFIIREDLTETLTNPEHDLVIGHWEIPRGQYYFTEDQWKRDITHMEFPENYSVYAFSPNTSFVHFNNLNAVKDYVNWHKKMVTVGEYEVPEWFWLATDQGILGHVIREGKYATGTLTDRIFLADNEYSGIDRRKYGYSEQWYYPMVHDKSKDDFDGLIRCPWEHVWLAKIVYGFDPNFMATETQRYFDEIWDLGGKEYLQHYRFSKYWREGRHE